MPPSQRLVSFVGEYQSRTSQILEGFQNLFPRDIPIHPIPFFGPLETARILTVGLNPSWTEFKPWRRWPGQITPENLSRRLFYYFKLSFPRPHPWFGELQQAVSIVNCSYEINAAHTDLAPWATLAASNFHGEQRTRFENLLESESLILSRLVTFCPGLKLVVILPVEPQGGMALTAIQAGYSGKIENVPRYALCEWFWNNRDELNSLIHS